MDKIKIGALDFAVRHVTDLVGEAEADGKRASLNGEIKHDACEVRVNASLATPVKRVTVVHEILHGIFYNADVTEHDEHLISVLAYGLVQVLRDNPDLVRMITEVDGGSA